MKDRILVSPEMLAFVGAGGIDTDDWPARPLMILFAGRGMGAMSGHVLPEPDHRLAGEAGLVFVVDQAACRRLFPGTPLDPGEWHLPTSLIGLVEQIGLTTAPSSCRDTLRLARSIELLCGFWTERAAGRLLPFAPDGGLSSSDTARIVAARRMVDERWGERLTLDAIARTCGINRAQLTRGFRKLYDCSVADTITSNRLDAARGLLLRSDLPVSAIGYRCGYANNASFTRAFARRFGLPPSRLRRQAA